MKIQRFLQQRATLVIVGIMTVGLTLSLIDGENQHLPPTALGSTILHHIERATVFLAAVYLLYVLVIYTTAGAIPHQLGGIEFQQLQEKEEEEAQTIEAFRHQVKTLQGQLNQQQSELQQFRKLLTLDTRPNYTTMDEEE